MTIIAAVTIALSLGALKATQRRPARVRVVAKRRK